jgi:hypothetical protein
LYAVHWLQDQLKGLTWPVDWSNRVHSTSRLGKVRAKEVCFNHQDPVLHRYGSQHTPSIDSISDIMQLIVDNISQIPCFIRFILYNYVAYFFFIDSSMLDFPSCKVRFCREYNYIRPVTWVEWRWDIKRKASAFNSYWVANAVSLPFICKLVMVKACISFSFCRIASEKLKSFN